MRILITAFCLATLMLAGCGGDDDSLTGPGTVGPVGTIGPEIASIDVITNNPQIPNDGAIPAIITAFAKDSGNNFVEGADVTFSASSGGIVVTQGTTDANGAATATLTTAGDATNRTITVTATAGGSSQTIDIDVVDPTIDPPSSDVADVDVITNNPQIPSDGGIPAVITAFVRDGSNNFVEGVDVMFTASSGGLIITQGATDANGTATASLTTAGDPTNRIITVTAEADGFSETIDISVTGSQLTISGPDSLVQGDSATYTIVLIDGAGTGIAGETLTISSANGNTLSASTLTTDPTGQAQVDLTATTDGVDTLTVSGLGLTATQVLSVSNDSFVFNTPAEGAEVALNTPQNFTVTWLQGAVPQAGETIIFSTTRGLFTGPSTVTTDGAGQASVTISSDNAGIALVTADAVGGPATQLQLEFVATTPFSIELQAQPFTVAPNNQATITAIVRDEDLNRVKNARVIFTLEDITGGTLSVGAGLTDSQGRAQTFYTANDVVSGNLAVKVTGTVEDVVPTITNFVNLTVARRELFVAFGTGNELIEPVDLASYQMPFLVIVTDSEGNGVPGVTVQFDVRSTRYSKGTWADLGGEFWVALTTSAICIDEDLNGNGILDPGEDNNGNDTIEAGNVVEVFPGGPMTDADGKAIINLLYPKAYGSWTEVNLRALLNVAGTEYSEDVTFVLQVLADDVKIDVAPPGILNFPDPDEGFPFQFISSPWGYATSCALDF